jgi:hypothetical protein
LDPILIQLNTHHTLKPISLAEIIIPVTTKASHFCLIQRVNSTSYSVVTEDFFPEDAADRTGEADHSLQSGAEIKNACDYTSISWYVFMVRCLITHRKTFTFLGVFVSIVTSVHLFAWNRATPTGQIFTLNI